MHALVALDAFVYGLEDPAVHQLYPDCRFRWVVTWKEHEHYALDLDAVLAVQGVGVGFHLFTVGSTGTLLLVSRTTDGAGLKIKYPVLAVTVNEDRIDVADHALEVDLDLVVVHREIAALGLR